VRRAVGSQALRFPAPPEGLHPWPAPATTDAAGRFRLRDLPPDSEIDLQVRDRRFAPQWLVVRTGTKESSGPVSLSLQPARTLEGMVTAADTGRPLPGARLGVTSMGPGAGRLTSRVDGEADAQGRFRIAPFPGRDLLVAVYPAKGTPYLALNHNLTWPAGSPRREANFALPAGVAVSGRVVEGASGRPVAGAAVEYRPRSDDNPHLRTRPGEPVIGWWLQDARTGPDGTFRLPVLPGPGWLLVRGPDPNYVHVEISARQIAAGLPGGIPYFPDAVVPLDPPPGGPVRVTARLRRGVTIRGRVLRQDGRPADKALVLTPTYIPRGLELAGDAIPARGGRFELPGCAPGKSVRVVVFEPESRQGGVADLRPGEPAVVRLAPCGSATVRVVDAAGRPPALEKGAGPRFVRARQTSIPLEDSVAPAPPARPARLDILLRPGAPVQESIDRQVDAYLTVPAQRLGGADCVRRDRHSGALTFTCLVPGATYLVQADEGHGTVTKCTFTPRPGRHRDLGQVVLRPPPGAMR
jgi:hypothetical protein